MYHEVIKVPANLALVSRGRLAPLADRSTRDASALGRYVHAGGACLLKPVRGGGGRNIHVVRGESDGLTVNGRRVDQSGLEAFLQTLPDSIVCEFARQADYAAALFPASSNSIRMVTMTDPDTLEPFLAAAVQRVGSSQTAPVNNFRQGGLSSQIDLETGELGPAVAYPHKLQLEWHDRHPETSAAIRGVRIPGWRQAVEAILVAAGHYPFIRYAGWDALLTNDGVWLLEGNHYPNVGLLQVHRPLLADPRVRRFYEHHRVIKPRRAGS
jgi:hypothetical protein